MLQVCTDPYRHQIASGHYLHTTLVPSFILSTCLLLPAVLLGLAIGPHSPTLEKQSKVKLASVFTPSCLL